VPLLSVSVTVRSPTFKTACLAPSSRDAERVQ
jgi:hypothetical protein